MSDEGRSRTRKRKQVISEKQARELYEMGLEISWEQLEAALDEIKKDPRRRLR